jgi:hypothetical protein
MLGIDMYNDTHVRVMIHAKEEPALQSIGLVTLKVDTHMGEITGMK